MVMEKFSHEPLRPEENAQHREMWQDIERRRWLRARIDIWIKTAGTLLPLILGAYTLWQVWKGLK